MRVKRPKKVVRARTSPPHGRSKKAAARERSPLSGWTKNSAAIGIGTIFLIVAAALLTAHEDSHRVYVETTPPPRLVKTPAPSVEENETQQPVAVTKIAAAQTADVTLAGCVESDKDSFVLTNATGAKAPTSRSWKSGFLKKRSAEIELADAAGTLDFRQYVGRRVAATGTLIEREMRTHSVRLVGSCE